jgi:hypothetical protein
MARNLKKTLSNTQENAHYVCIERTQKKKRILTAKMIGTNYFVPKHVHITEGALRISIYKVHITGYT